MAPRSWLRAARWQRRRSEMSSPHAKVRGVGLTDVTWTRGFWADRFALCRDVMVPTMGKLLMGTERARFLDNFLIAAGELDGRHRGPRWNDGDFYKWFEGAAAIYQQTHDEKLDREMD